MNENSLKNLELGKWKKGQVTNPDGRPKKEFSLTDGMRDYLSEHDPIRKQERKTILIEKTFSMAQRGDIAAIKLLWNYLEGMPKGSGVDVNIDNRSVNFIGSPEQLEDIDKFAVLRVKEMIKSNLIRKEEL